jgi:glucose/arabinose dehydrogenase
VALRLHPETGTLFGVVHGRDSLSEMFPDLFDLDARVEKPSEEFITIPEGSDFGWPYCYHDPETDTKVLAPEYGGDGEQVGRCAAKDSPLLGFPAHWAPNDLEFYTGETFPGRYRGGAFVAFHGSWNRAPAPQAGYNVVFVPMEGDRVVGEWEVFADGFAGEDVSPRGADHRPVGVVMGPDGSLYVSDSQSGRIWRITYRGT